MERLSVAANAQLEAVFGADFHKHNNIHKLDDDTLLYAVGNAVRIHNITTGSMQYVLGRDGGGVGAVAVHPARTCFAVAERSVGPAGTSNSAAAGPAIYIYSYPELKVTHVLSCGTERGYTDVNFSAGGDKLVSVGAFPDFFLTVWQWEASRMVLRTKAFGQEVFNARFSPDDDGHLTTSGTGHIRFWRMAATFTGLKLQGDIGKFGRVDLSDIHAFADCPDGKVVSGSESGMLLLWDGSAIKTQIGRRGEARDEEAAAKAVAAGGAEYETLPCHDAPVHVVQLDRELGTFITGGDDGILRWWDFKAVDSADMLPDGHTIPGLVPVCEFEIGPSVKLRGLVRIASTPIEGGQRITWLAQDGQGSMWRIRASVAPNAAGSSTLNVEDCEQVFRGHAGAVTGMQLSPLAGERIAATIGSDGSVRAWDVASKRLLLATRYQHAPVTASSLPKAVPGTALAWAPLSVDPSGRTVAVGFADGTLRILYRGNDEWKRLAVLKPHISNITSLTFSPDGRMLVSAGSDGTVFFIRIAPKTGGSGMEADTAPAELGPAFRMAYKPLGFLPLAPVVAEDTPGSPLPGPPSPTKNEQPPGGAAAPAAAVVDEDNDGTGGIPALCATFSADGSALSLGCEDGTVRVIAIPPPDAFPDAADATTYDLTGFGTLRVSLFRPSIDLRKAAPPPPKEKAKPAAEGKAAEGKAAEAPPPVPEDVIVKGNTGRITALAYAASSDATAPVRLLLGTDGDAAHMLLEVQLPKSASTSSAPRSLRPVAAYPVAHYLAGEHVHQPHVCLLRYSPSGKLLLVGTTAGSVQLRSAMSPAAFMRLQVHDGESGHVHAISMDVEESMIASAAGDGTVATLRLLDGVAGTLAALAAAVPESTAASMGQYKAIDVREAIVLATGLATATPGNKDAEGAPAEAGAEGAPAAAPDAAAPTAPAAEGGDSAPVEQASAAHLADVLAAASTPLPYLPALPPADASPAAQGAAEPLEPAASDLWLTDHQATDINTPSAYSVQQDRLRSEADRRRRDAEGEKAKTRKVIAQLRDGFSALRVRSQAESTVHPARGLTADELQLDPVLIGILQEEGEEKLREVDRECSYERQKRRVAISKLVGAYLSDVETDVITVTGIGNADINVQSLRTQVMTPSLAAAAEEAAATNVVEVAAARALFVPEPPLVLPSERNAAEESKAADGKAAEEKEAEIPEDAASISFDARKALRAERQAGLQALRDKRPGPTDEFPPDVAKVNWAKENMGDYRLKMGKEYKLPLGVKVDAPTKRRQLLLLEAHVYNERKGFNDAVMRLRQRKRAVIAALKDAEAEINAIDAELTTGQTAAICTQASIALSPPPALLQPEVAGFVLPALRLTSEETEGYETLPELAARHVADAKAELEYHRHASSATAASSSGYSGVMSTFLRKLQALKQAAVPSSQAATSTSTSTSSTTSAGASSGIGSSSAGLGSVSAGPAVNAHAAILEPAAAGVGASYVYSPERAHAAVVVPSASPLAPVLSVPAHKTASAPSMEEAEAAAVAYRALCDRKAALRLRQGALIAGFDYCLQELRRRRLVVQAHTATAALRLLVLRQELALLSDMAKRDAALDARLSKAKADKAAISAATAGYAVVLAEKKTELDHLAVKEKKLLAEFDEMVGTSHPAYGQLAKIYKRKIKRAKAKAPGAAEEEEDEDDDDDLEGLGDEDEDEEEDDSCPDACDKILYEKVLLQRNKRLDVDDAAADIKAVMDETRKANDRQVQRERQVDRDLGSITNEIIIFQREKQGKLNQIDVWFTLRFSQLVMGKQSVTGPEDDKPIGLLPSSIDSCVLFTRAALRRLRARIGELEEENKGLQAGMKELHREEARLAAEKRRLEGAIAETRTASEQLQMLKFGRTIDITDLDKATGVSADSMARVQAEIADNESAEAAETAAVKARLQALQDQLTAVTRAHTETLESLATASARYAALESELSGRVEKGLQAVALHATLGSALASSAFAGKIGATSLAAIAPALNKTAVPGKPTTGPNSTAAVTAGLQLSHRGGGGGLIAADETAAAKQEAHERDKLTALVKAQASELEALKAEIRMLKSKGSVAYAQGPSTGTAKLAASLRHGLPHTAAAPVPLALGGSGLQLTGKLNSTVPGQKQGK